MLTTIGDGGRIHSPTQAITDEGDLWFFTRDESAKTHELESHPEVNVAYADASRQRYVSIAGRGRSSGTLSELVHCGIPRTAPGSRMDWTIRTSRSSPSRSTRPSAGIRARARWCTSPAS